MSWDFQGFSEDRIWIYCGFTIIQWEHTGMVQNQQEQGYNDIVGIKWREVSAAEAKVPVVPEHELFYPFMVKHHSSCDILSIYRSENKRINHSSGI